jgi:hypothetical protein
MKFRIIIGIIKYFGLPCLAFGVTIHKSEEVNFRSKFYRSCDRKGVCNTKRKYDYSLDVRAKIAMYAIVLSEIWHTQYVDIHGIVLPTTERKELDTFF